MSAFNPEAAPRREAQEQAPKPAKIRLELFRHDAKTKDTVAGPREGDSEVRLTPEGRKHATEVGKAKDPKPEVSISYGSPRERAQETALRHMLANDERITGDSSLEEMRELIGGELKYGRKDAISPLLDFEMEGNPEFNKVAYDHYLNKKDMLDWLKNESDDVVRQLNDPDSSSYSRQAGNVAELIQKYVKVYPRWKQIVDQDPQKYAEFDNEMQRHLGSHQGVTESFLMKVIEKTEGREGVDRFIDSLSSRNGFDLSEGFSVNISGDEQEPTLTFRFRDQEWQVSPSMIEQMVQERDELNNETKGGE